MSDIEKLHKAIIRFHNRMTGKSVESILDISAEDHEFLCGYSYIELCQPFIIEDLKKGMSLRAIASKYDTHIAPIRGIGRKALMLKCR